MRYGVVIQMRSCAALIASTKNSEQVSTLSAGPLGMTRQCMPSSVDTYDGASNGGNCCVAQYQSSVKTNWMLATAGPRTSMCVSRHGESGGCPPRYSTPTL